MRSDSNTDLSYAACRDALEDLEAPLSAAEVHGALCAMLCTRRPTRIGAWVAEIVSCDVDASAARALGRAGERAHNALSAGEYQFEPLLPDDDHSLEERSRALADWCTGFLHGLGLAGTLIRESLSDDGREVVADFIELSKLDPDDDPSEENERAYAELVEFVRVGVTLVYEELIEPDRAAGSPGALH